MDQPDEGRRAGRGRRVPRGVTTDDDPNVYHGQYVGPPDDGPYYDWGGPMLHTPTPVHRGSYRDALARAIIAPDLLGGLDGPEDTGPVPVAPDLPKSREKGSQGP